MKLLKHLFELEHGQVDDQINQSHKYFSTMMKNGCFVFHVELVGNLFFNYYFFFFINKIFYS